MPSMLRPTLLLFFLILIQSEVLAQRLIVKNQDFEPIEGATASLIGGEGLHVSDASGVIQLAVESQSSFRVSHVGYAPQIVSISPGQTRTVILSLLEKSLGDISVEGFANEKTLNYQAAAISRVSSAALFQNNETSPVEGLNTVAGLRFEERAGASYRVSIRGSSIRSPFGVRNVKVYWNDLPFTEPGGNTFLNLLDLNNMGEVEVIRGPAASIYGAGNGGVLKIRSTVPGDLNNVTKVDLISGSYGLLRSTISGDITSEAGSFTIKLSSQEADGYREHNAMDRKTAELGAIFFPSNRRLITASILYSDLFYQIPGGLNPEQRAENPRQSRPRSIERNSSVANETYVIKLGQEYDFADDFSNKTTLGLSFNQFENPFILDYKRDNQQVFSGRTEFKKEMSLFGRSSSVVFGGEFQKSYTDAKNFGNVNGQADTIRFADELSINQAVYFASVNHRLPAEMELSLGLSLNDLTYDIDRTVDRINGTPQSFRKNFDTFLAKRLALSKQLGERHSIHLSWMTGLSNPTTTEVRTNEGSINQLLQAEEGTNYELNFRGAYLNDRLSFDLSLFHFQLKDAITTFTNGQGVVLFRNAGETRQNGLELNAKYSWFESSDDAKMNVESHMAYTYHDFSFEDYVDVGGDFSGNALPGTAKNVLNISTRLTLKNGFYFNLNYRYSDPIPLTDENTFYSRAFNLLNTKVGYSGDLDKRLGFEVFAGMNNLFDVSYSLGNDLNAFGRRYFQPAPDRNVYFGLKLQFKH